MDETTIPSQSRRTLASVLKVDNDKIWGWILLIIPPLAVAGPYASLTPGKAGAIYAFRALILLLIIPALVTATADIRKSRALQFFSAFMAIFLSWAAITLLWTPDRSAGKTEVLAMSSSMLGAWILLALTRRRSQRVKMVLYGWFLSALGSIVLSAIEIFTGFHPLLIGSQWPWRFTYSVVAGTFANPNNYGAYIVGMFTLSGCLALVAKSHWLRALCYLVMPILAVLVVGTSSRGCEAGLFAAALIILALTVVQLKDKKYHAAIMIAMMVISLAIAVGLKSETLARWDDFANPSASGHVELPPDPNAPKATEEQLVMWQQWEADRERVQLIKRGLYYFTDKPFQGNGAGSFVSLTIKDPLVAPIRPLGQNAHNMFIQVVVHYGVLGILLVVGIFSYAFQRLFRGDYGRQFLLDPSLYLGLGLFLGLMLSIVLASDMIGLPVTWPIFSTILALGWGRWPGPTTEV